MLIYALILKNLRIDGVYRCYFYVLQNNRLGALASIYGKTFEKINSLFAFNLFTLVFDWTIIYFYDGSEVLQKKVGVYSQHLFFCFLVSDKIHKSYKERSMYFVTINHPVFLLFLRAYDHNLFVFFILYSYRIVDASNKIYIKN